jgi:hypothetical protein
MLNPKIVTTIAKQIHRQFPEVAGSAPTVRVQRAPQSKSPPTESKVITPSPHYLLTFRGTGTTADGISIPRLVRVVVNYQGKILKVTTSK